MLTKGTIHSLFWFIILAYHSNCQIINMCNGQLKTASAILYDSGGENQNYYNNEQLSLTICPEDNGKYIELTFLEFETEKGFDVLTINVDSQQSDDVYHLSGQMLSEVITSKNKNGCIQLDFLSDGLNNFSGFKIKVEQVSTPSQPTIDKAGNNTCVNAAPFCASANYNFPNTTNQPAATGGNFGCLGTRPNPAWYFMRIGDPGSVILNVVQTANDDGSGTALDVDFAMWGPFTSTAEACNRIITNSTPLAPIQCSYSTSYQETIALGATGGVSGGQTTPANGQTGQIYMVLLTNYSNQSGFISFNQTGGTGTIDCSIIPLSVNLTSITARNSNNQNIISWTSLYSNYTSHYEIEHSTDGYYWNNLDRNLPNQMHPIYEVKHTGYNHCKNYYRLVEYNNNGDRILLHTLLIDNTLNQKEIIKIVNTLGQDVEPNTPGLKIYLYDDGTSVKTMN